MGMNEAVKTLRENPSIRRIAIPAYKKMTSLMVFGKGPRVLVNSLPKAGTHLLTSLLRGLPRMTHSGRHFVLDDFRMEVDRPSIWGDVPVVDWDRLGRDLARLNRGQFLTSHCPAVPTLLRILDGLDYKVLFIVRDPRDVVVSSALYISRLQRHIMHARYKQLFHSDEERIMGTITGFPPDSGGRGAESIGSKLSRYMPWLDSPLVQSCRFESLVGPAGGGSVVDQIAEVRRVVEYLDLRMSSSEISSLSDRVWTRGSPTFRRGLIGDWRNHFTDEHKTAFKEIAGEHLIALGYENDLDW
jgi:sulfotransferase 6B1